MDVIRRVTTDDFPAADVEQLTESLKQWQKEGVEDPHIPYDVDVDGDGIVDAIGLNAFGELVFVKAPIDETVYAATGPF